MDQKHSPGLTTAPPAARALPPMGLGSLPPTEHQEPGPAGSPARHDTDEQRAEFPWS